jgi:effector-binding domain-containing protein
MPAEKGEHIMKNGSTGAVTAGILAGIALVALLAPAAAAQDLAVAVKDVEPFPYLAITHKGPYTDMGTVIGQLVGAMQAQGQFPQVRGPMVGVYYNAPGVVAPGELSWEVGFIVAAQAAANPPLVKKVWEHRTVAAALYVGPYDGAGGAIEKIMGWLAAHGYDAAGPVLERYLDQNPAAVKPEALRTEIWIPCIRPKRTK